MSHRNQSKIKMKYEKHCDKQKKENSRFLKMFPSNELDFWLDLLSKMHTTRPH